MRAARALLALVLAAALPSCIDGAKHAKEKEEAKKVTAQFYRCMGAGDWNCVSGLVESPNLLPSLRVAAEGLGKVSSLDYRHSTSVEGLEGDWKVRFDLLVVSGRGKRHDNLLLIRRGDAAYRIVEYAGGLPMDF
ncbi:MAG TPA: hypothetical protein VFO11_04635 [Candidatus Polarisedimenticolaceae bacterium]|nr:hypothetical protein [Candidatus Polarisedimenticolaceae bacterium]